ncbi:MAG: hypothetical protein AAFN78_05550 [Pseudomonadota bacterium]
MAQQPVCAGPFGGHAQLAGPGELPLHAGVLVVNGPRREANNGKYRGAGRTEERCGANPIVKVSWITAVGLDYERARIYGQAGRQQTADANDRDEHHRYPAQEQACGKQQQVVGTDKSRREAEVQHDGRDDDEERRAEDPTAHVNRHGLKERQCEYH